MIVEENLIKPKIFIRYPGGGSGHFLALVVLALVRDVTMTETYRGHKDLKLYNRYHNWQQQWRDNRFKSYTDSTSIEATEYIKNTYKFYPTPDPYYVVHTHANNPSSILDAFDQSRLINVTFTSDDIDQLSYNWIYKSYFLHQQWHLMRQGLKKIKSEYKKLLDVDEQSINNETDVKLLTYIEKYSGDCGRKQYQGYVPATNHNIFEIKFSDIASKQILNTVDSIIDFLQVDVAPGRKENVINIINNYADAQITVPWQLTLNDYN
jgi:hypothetical protein